MLSGAAKEIFCRVIYLRGAARMNRQPNLRSPGARYIRGTRTYKVLFVHRTI